MRLIDTDSVAEVKFQFKDNAYKKGWNEAIETIVQCEPTVDAVEVVRCKDCLHCTCWETDTGEKLYVCKHWNLNPTELDAFCSNAFKK